MGTTTSYPAEHYHADKIVNMAVKDCVEKSKLAKAWREGVANGRLPEDEQVPWYWMWTRAWYGREPPRRWVEGVTVIEEDEHGNQWETHVDVKDSGMLMGPRFVHNWNRRKVNTVC
mmetsp:Transcript_48267/g.90339  ORF Transcript_48267/g.90339 Transcript_48267/m.90339 type:complete len:116 (+) Transcript_48267:85-432(+)